MDTQEFTIAQVDAMREALRKIDAASRPKTIDMSQPVIVPYRYQPFPKTLYNHEECKPSRFETTDSALPGGKPETKAVPPVFVTKTVNSIVELDEAIAEGWKTDAPNFNTPPWAGQLSASEGQYNNALADSPRRGRPAKTA